MSKQNIFSHRNFRIYLKSQRKAVHDGDDELVCHGPFWRLVALLNHKHLGFVTPNHDWNFAAPHGLVEHHDEHRGFGETLKNLCWVYFFVGQWSKCMLKSLF